jgi:hypothetical protein
MSEAAYREEEGCPKDEMSGFFYESGSAFEQSGVSRS